MLNIGVVIGTRPEAIKLAPVIREISLHSDCFPRVIATGQHKELLDDVLESFGIVADVNLQIMTENQTLTDLTAKCLIEIESVLKQIKPNILLVQGDTTSAFVGTLAAYYQKIPVAHVEAGLRTREIYSPYPEEGNRRLISALAEFHFAPTARAKQNLIFEGVNPEKILVTGNTVIDALLWASRQPCKFNPTVENFIKSKSKKILVTIHRRENWGAILQDICEALVEVVTTNNNFEILLPMHPNPEVRRIICTNLSACKQITLVGPLNYLEMSNLMKAVDLILTDSGGIQEEAPALNKPVLVLRETTERPEGVEAGTSRLIGIKRRGIVEQTLALLEDSSAYEQMSLSANPYGDGSASKQIVEFLRNKL